MSNFVVEKYQDGTISTMRSIFCTLPNDKPEGCIYVISYTQISLSTARDLLEGLKQFPCVGKCNYIFKYFTRPHTRFFVMLQYRISIYALYDYCTEICKSNPQILEVLYSDLCPIFSMEELLKIDNRRRPNNYFMYRQEKKKVTPVYQTKMKEHFVCIEKAPKRPANAEP